MEDIKIPIDKQLEEFGNHILANPRTFVSIQPLFWRFEI